MAESLQNANDDPSATALASLLAASDHSKSFDSLDSLDVDYTAREKEKGSFTYDRGHEKNEFDLPDLDEDNLPTLESILNEPDDSPFPLDNYGNLQSAGLIPGVPGMMKHNKPNQNGSVLRHVILKKISGQMLDACERRTAGLPTAMAVSSVIAVGTSHGLVLIFEPRDQALKFILGSTEDGAKYGAVTALGINLDCSRLLCGYAKGQITMWDLNNGNCLRVITDAHPPEYAVLHLQFTDDSTVAMCNDSSGSVYSLNFRRFLTRSCESVCFFSGSKGEVCVMAPLHLHPDMKHSQLSDSSLLALASLTKVIIVSMKPSPKAIFTKKLPGGQNTLPLLGWQFAVIQKEKQAKHLCPVLAFARDRQIHFYQIWKQDEEFCCIHFKTIETEYSLVSMHWMNPKIIVTIDVLERIRTIDVGTSEELECLDLGIVQLVYGSSYFKSLSTGGNVSKALNAASEYACYHSVQVFNGQLLLLGTKTIHCLTIRTWKDRIDYFVRQNMFLEALKLGLSFYEEKAKAVVNLAGTRKKRRLYVGEEIAEVLLSYVDVSMTVNCPKTHDEATLRGYYSSLVPTCVEYCVATDNLRLLFGEIYERFSEDSVAKHVLLEGLEPYILDDKVGTLTPVVMQDLVEHFEQTGQLNKLEACLVHLDVTAVNLHHMVKLCWTHALYDLAIYVYNKGMADYITPLEELLGILKSLVKNKKTLDQSDSVIGYKILVYISCCLAGKQYPRGLIAEEMIPHVKHDVFECIVKRRAKDPVEGDPSFPYLHILLEFDTREFLNVMSIAFEEPEFEADGGSGLVSKRQRVVDILLQIMVTDVTFSPTQVGWLFTFIARQMAKFEKSIRVNKLLFEQVLEYLSNSDDNSRHEERQQALLELLAAGGLKQFDDERIIALAESAKFYRVCEVLYEKKNMYAKVFSCYTRDPARKQQSFSYIDELLQDDSFTDLQRAEVQDAVLASLNELVVIDSSRTAGMIANHFPDCIDHVVGKLEYEPKVQYQFLKGIFQPQESAAPSSSRKMIGKSRDAFVPEPSIHEQFIELMCRYDPGDVYLYLRGTDNYRLEQSLAIVQRMKIVDANAFLLEKTGDVQGAFKLLLDNLKAKAAAFSQSFAEGDDPMSSREGREKRRALKNALNAVIQLCQRNSSRLDNEDREALWFPLLESVMAPQRRVKDVTSPHFVAFKDMTKQVLSSMMGYIALPAVLQKIMQDPAYNTGKFGEIKELILGMLDTYNYELTLLETTKSLLGTDLHTAYCKQKQSLSRGFSPDKLLCGLCLEKYGMRTTPDSINDISLFKCGHSFHKQCLEGAIGFGSELACLLCNKASVMLSSTSSASHDKSTKSKTSSPGPSRGKSKMRTKKKADPEQILNEQQIVALSNLEKHNREASKLNLLADLSTNESFRDWARSSSSTITRSMPASFLKSPEKLSLAGKDFQLKLAPSGINR
eukprot:gene15740-17326_t